MTGDPHTHDTSIHTHTHGRTPISKLCLLRRLPVCLASCAYVTTGQRVDHHSAVRTSQRYPTYGSTTVGVKQTDQGETQHGTRGELVHEGTHTHTYTHARAHTHTHTRTHSHTHARTYSDTSEFQFQNDKRGLRRVCVCVCVRAHVGVCTCT